MRLHRLTGLEHEKLLNEYQEKLAEIADYIDILEDFDRLLTVIREELAEMATEFGDQRRTEITASQHDLTVEDLITEEDRVVTISNGGYAKTQPLSDYQAQKRGGMGRAALAVKDEDFVEHLLIASTHATLLCFSNLGKVYWLKVYQIPLAGRGSRGRPMVNLLPLEPGERVTSILPVEDYTPGHFIFMATAGGTVKKTPLEISPASAASVCAPSNSRRGICCSAPRSRTAIAKSCCSAARARLHASASRTCDPWAARRAGCSAFDWGRGIASYHWSFPAKAVVY